MANTADAITLTEQKTLIESRLRSMYATRKHNGKTCFRNNAGVWFNINKLGKGEPYGCFVIEYMDTWEDGDTYYPSDYDSFEDMLDDMLKEIEC